MVEGIERWVGWDGMEKREGEDERVDVVDANILIPNQHLSFLRFRNWDVGFILEDLRSARLFDPDALHGFREIRGRHGAYGVEGRTLKRDVGA
jgi:hypothetical protein